jgi:hypothetical protein
MLDVQCLSVLDSLAAAIQSAFFIPLSLSRRLAASNPALREQTGALAKAEFRNCT